MVVRVVLFLLSYACVHKGVLLAEAEDRDD